MKIFHLPENTEALSFDVDMTLYTNPEFAKFQVDFLVKKLSERRGQSFDEMNRDVEEARKAWALSHNGMKPCLTEILSGYGISMEENIGWRLDNYEPERFLGRDEKLKAALEKLSRFFFLGIVTNNPVLVARKTLAALGVEDCFSVLVGLDTCMKPKPNKELFLKFTELSKKPAERCISIGDRYDIDLCVPLEIGMGGILVDGVEDVYSLPELLLNTR